MSRLDFSTVNLAGYAANPLTISAVDLDISTIDIVSCQFDINDSDIIYVIVKDGSKRSFLQRWEYRPVYMTAPDSFSWLVQLSKQSPSAVTNFVRVNHSPLHLHSFFSHGDLSLFAEILEAFCLPCIFRRNSFIYHANARKSTCYCSVGWPARSSSL